jgi:tripartite-type tricarboxylate transporter receptor subunit TctC
VTEFLIGIAMLAFSCLAFTQDAAKGGAYPSRPVRMIVAVAPGGSTDVVGRIISGKLAESFGKSFVVDNRAGAGGILGNDIVAKSQPDGHTLLFTYAGHTIVPFIGDKIPYDVNRDFVPITLVASQPLLLTVNPTVPVKSVGDLIALARAKPNFLNAALPTTSSSGSLAVELLKIMTETKMVSVAFKGGAQAITAVLSGEMHFIFLPPSTVQPHLAVGKVRVLATTGKVRFPDLPSVPTMAEAGIKDFEMQSWQGILAPARTPNMIIDKLYAATMTILKQPEVRARLAATGSNIEGTTPKEFADRITRELIRNKELVKAVGMSVIAD